MTTAAELRDELQAVGVALAADGDRLRFSPRSAVTGELLQGLRDCKAELLKLLASGPQDGDGGPVAKPLDLPGDGSKDLQPQDLPGGDRHGADGPQDAGPSDIDAGEWQDIDTPDGWILQRIDAAGLEIIDAPTPCPTCNGLDFWQDAAGGLHCVTCSPAKPTGERLRRRAAELRQRYERNPRR